MVENKSTAEFFSKIFKACGPITTPDIISPIMLGIFNRRNNIGANNMMARISEKISTGLCNGV